jgi:hypothetical protein
MSAHAVRPRTSAARTCVASEHRAGRDPATRPNAAKARRRHDAAEPCAPTPFPHDLTLSTRPLPAESRLLARRPPRRGAATTQPNPAHPRRSRTTSHCPRIRCPPSHDCSPGGRQGAAPPRRSRTPSTHAVPTPYPRVHARIVLRAPADPRSHAQTHPRRGAATTQPKPALPRRTECPHEAVARKLTQVSSRPVPRGLDVERALRHSREDRGRSAKKTRVLKPTAWLLRECFPKAGRVRPDEASRPDAPRKHPRQPTARA